MNGLHNLSCGCIRQLAVKCTAPVVDISCLIQVGLVTTMYLESFKLACDALRWLQPQGMCTRPASPPLPKLIRWQEQCQYQHAVKPRADTPVPTRVPLANTAAAGGAAAAICGCYPSGRGAAALGAGRRASMGAQGCGAATHHPQHLHLPKEGAAGRSWRKCVRSDSWARQCPHFCQPAHNGRQPLFVIILAFF